MSKPIPVLLMFLGMAVTLGFQHRQLTKIKAERDVLQNNTYSLLSDMEQLHKDSALQAYQIQSLSLTVNDLKTYRAEDLQTIDELKIKLRNVKAISKQDLEVDIPIQAPIIKPIIKDSIAPFQLIKLSTPHFTFDGRLYPDSLMANINIPVQLKQIVHKVPKHKFLWWSWGCKGIKQVVTTNNPYVHLKYSEYIELR